MSPATLCLMAENIASEACIGHGLLGSFQNVTAFFDKISVILHVPGFAGQTRGEGNGMSMGKQLYNSQIRG